MYIYIVLETWVAILNDGSRTERMTVYFLNKGLSTAGKEREWRCQGMGCRPLKGDRTPLASIHTSQAKRKANDLIQSKESSSSKKIPSYHIRLLCCNPRTHYSHEGKSRYTNCTYRCLPCMTPIIVRNIIQSLPR